MTPEDAALAATFARVIVAVCALPEVNGRLEKRDVINVIRDEMPAIPVPRKPQEESHV